jgi:hypothetical protein
LDMLGQAAAPRAVEQDDGSELLLGDASRVAEPRSSEASSGHQHFAGNDHVGLDSADEFDATKTVPAFAGLLDQSDIELVQVSVRGAPFAQLGDQALISMAPQQPSNDPSAEQFKTIVADALEGRTLDLDILLGTQTSPENALPQIQLADSQSGGFLASSGMLSLGNLFMPDMAEQHVMAQMEHAAATGHA